MKKLFFFASAAALLVTSCSDDLGFKNQGQEVEGNFTITATYNMGSDEEPGTRTELVTNGSKKQYQWSQADAIGVFVAGEEDNTNALFSYSTGNGASGSFRGNLNALDGNLYIGYYPYYLGAQVVEEDAGIEDSENPYPLGLKMTISEYQNYNSSVYNPATDKWSFNPPSGSFSQGEAPAVGYGYAASGQLAMQFFPIASYLVFPVTTYDDITITNLELTVSLGSEATTLTPQNLAGSFYVNVDNVVQGWEPEYEVASAEEDASDANGQDFATTIKLSCGKGVALSQGQTANFWFVVPADLVLQNATVQVVVNTDGKNKDVPASSTLTKVLGVGSANPVGANQIKIIVPDSGNAWIYNNNNTSFPISTQAQFLEYAYLVTNPEAAITAWSAMRGNGDWVNYSNLQNMVEWSSSTDITDLKTPLTTANISKIKDAAIVGNIQFNYQTLGSQLGFNINSAVPQYYTDVFKAFINNKGVIPTIGTNGWYSFNIYGVTEDAALSGLGISNSSTNGYGFINNFSGNIKNSVSLSDITLNNITVTYPSSYTSDYAYMLAEPVSGQEAFSNVTVSSSCSVVASGVKKGTCLFLTDQSAFNEWNKYSNTWYFENNVTGVTNETNMKFASELKINSAYPVNSTTAGFYNYDFSESGRTVSDFNKITLVANDGSTQNGYGALLNVAKGESLEEGEENALALMKAIVSGGNTTTAYSVIDGSNSYWTGRIYSNTTSWLVEGTAEHLATLVQQGYVNNDNSDKTFELGSWNLDLMGSYAGTSLATNQSLNTYWVVNKNVTAQTYPIFVQGSYSSSKGWTYLNINNVFIDGTTNGSNVNTEYTYSNAGNSYNYLTLFGYCSSVSHVNITDITIAPNAAANQNYLLVIGALSSYNANQNSNITNNVNVTNMTVEIENMTNIYGSHQYYKTGVAGGLFCALTNNDLKRNVASNGTNYTPLQSVSVEPRVYGETTGNEAGFLAGVLNYTLEGTNETLYNPYNGTLAATRQPFGVFNLIVNPSASFTSSTINLSSYSYYNVEDNVMDINITTTSDLNDGYSVYIQTSNARYLWQYNANKDIFVYQGTVIK